MRLLSALLLSTSLYAQTTVPFIGCPSDGPAGPVEAPTGQPVRVSVSPQRASQLAYYAARGIGFLGTLAPRDWHCFQLHGPRGDSLYITPEPIDAERINPGGFTGPIIEIGFVWGEGIGRYAVAPIVPRLFPEHRDPIARELDQEREFFSLQMPKAPYPTDKLVRRRTNLVEFTTPPNTKGIGTDGLIAKSSLAVRGAAHIQVPLYHLTLLRVRLPKDFDKLTPAILDQFVKDTTKQSR